MATSTVVPPLKAPTRSMTHPLRDPKANGPRRRVKNGEPFDPEELSRRLHAHIVEQKLKSEQRRAARAAKEAALRAQNGYHHVPSVAATSFERTTTQAKPLKMHKLSQPILRTHLEHVSIDNERPTQPLTLLQKTLALDQAALEAHQLRTRNQFQWTQELEEANEVDSDRDLYKPPQRTFNGEFAHLIGSPKKDFPRPMSTGDLLWEEERSSPPPPKHKAKLAPHDIVNDHRNDWAQRDDEGENRKKDKTSPFLRKMESSWMLIGKREKVKERRDEGISGLGSSPPEKGVKGSFLARFKRHPS